MQFEWNARTQITMWYDNTEEEASLLRDYGEAIKSVWVLLLSTEIDFMITLFVPFLLGNKYWSGLLLDYYGPRAAIYFKFLTESLENGHGFQLNAWRREWIELTNNWQKSRKIFPVKSGGIDALNVSRWLYDKYLRNPRTYDH